MGMLVNILVGWTLFLLIQGHNAKKIPDILKPLNETTGSKKADIIAVPLTIAASIASTYIKNWMMKEQSAVMSIINLSDDYWMEDGCDSALNTDVRVPPTNLKPKDGATTVEAGVDSRGRMITNEIKEVWNKLFKPSQITGDYFDQNLWMRCAFKKPSQAVGNSDKIVIFITLRGGRNTVNKMQTTLFVAMCQEGTGEINAEENCVKFSTVKKIKDMLKEYYKPQGNKKPVNDDIAKNVLRTQVYEKNVKMTKAWSKKLYTKEQMMLPLMEPIYFCNEKTKSCVSAMMGNGGKLVSQIYFHKLTAGGTEAFKPFDPTDQGLF